MGAIMDNTHAYNLIRALVWQSIILLSAFAFDLFGYFRKSEVSITSIIRVLVLSAKLVALVYQCVWLCNTPNEERNQDETTVAVLAVMVVLLFSVTDVVALSIMDLPHLVIVFVTCVATFLHLLMTSIDWRARKRQLEVLKIVPFVVKVSGIIGSAAVLGSFLWSTVAVVSHVGKRELELAAILLLGLATAAVVLGTLYISLYMNRLLTSGRQVHGKKQPLRKLYLLPGLSGLETRS